MKKLILITAVIGLLSSCGSVRQDVSNFTTFVTQVKDSCNNYSSEDWEKANYRYGDYLKKLEREKAKELTFDETRKLTFSIFKYIQLQPVEKRNNEMADARANDLKRLESVHRDVSNFTTFVTQVKDSCNNYSGEDWEKANYRYGDYLKKFEGEKAKELTFDETRKLTFSIFKYIQLQPVEKGNNEMADADRMAGKI